MKIYVNDYRENGRNPVFALEMIQTNGGKASQANATTKGRNPVFALEMIQTIKKNTRGLMYRKSRNPVFALEMIQTALAAYARLATRLSVAIQYSPWR